MQLTVLDESISKAFWYAVNALDDFFIACNILPFLIHPFTKNVKINQKIRNLIKYLLFNTYKI